MLRHLNLAKIQSLMVCGVSVIDRVRDICILVDVMNSLLLACHISDVK
jgi:hypothetical protein